MLGRGKPSVCGQVLDGASKVAPSVSPGCWTAKNRGPVVVRPASGPQASAPFRHGEELLARRPRRGPSTGTRKMPSLDPSTLPSVEIQRLPSESNATLSGQLIGLTLGLVEAAEPRLGRSRVAAHEHQVPA